MVAVKLRLLTLVKSMLRRSRARRSSVITGRRRGGLSVVTSARDTVVGRCDEGEVFLVFLGFIRCRSLTEGDAVCVPRTTRGWERRARVICLLPRSCNKCIALSWYNRENVSESQESR